MVLYGCLKMFVATDLKLPTSMSIYLKPDIRHKINIITTNHLILIKILYI